jgi:Na+/pantothenate symporter
MFQVAFDVVLATAVIPLFGCFYCKKPSPRAALLSVLVGGFSRIIMEVRCKKNAALFVHVSFRL